MRQWTASSPPRLASGPLLDLPDEFRIPLPPSISGSEYGEEPEHSSQKQEQEQQQMWEREQEQRQRQEGSHGQEQEQGQEREQEQQQKDGTTPRKSQEHGGEANTHHMPESQAHPSEDPNLAEPSSSKVAQLPMPLLELMDLIERDTYEKERNLSLQRHVSGLLRQCGNNSRFIPVRSYIYRRMVECFRTDKKTTFASLYTQSLKLEGQASSYSQDFLGTTDKDIDPGHIPSDFPVWFSALSPDSKNDSLAFLGSLRNDTSFLADRIACLSSAQLNALARPHRQALAPESVQESSPGYSKFDPRNFQRNLARTVESSTGPISMMHDPLFLFLNGIFDPMSRWNSRERNRQLDIWSSVCARIIEEGKPGSDDLCLVALDAFAEFTPWTVKPELELFLQDLIHTGHFIVDPQADQHSIHTLPIELRNARVAVKTAEFFEKASNTLLDLVTKGPSSAGIPRAALDLIHATLRKIKDSERRNKARSFFVSRWYCTSFLSNALLFPERHQMLLKNHISAAVRQKIFRELAVRLQKVLFEALSPHSSSSNLSSKTTEAGTQKLLALFEPGGDFSIGDRTSRGASESERPFLLLSSRNILSMTRALYPGSRPSSNDSTFKKAPSIASSFTGSSTLTAGTSDQRTGTASSVSPSISGTSVTSNTLSSDISFSHFDKTQEGTRTIETPYKSRPSTSGGLESRLLDDSSVKGFLPELWDATSTHNKNDYSDCKENGLVLYICNSDGSIHLSPKTLHPSVGPTHDVENSSRPEIPLMSPTRESLMEAISQASRRHHSLTGISRNISFSDPLSLNVMFQHLLAESRSGHDFQTAHLWFRSLQLLSRLSAHDKIMLVNDSADEYLQSIRLNSAMSDSYQDWVSSLQMLQRRQMKIIRQLALQTDALRIKMWFTTDVRHSSTYEDTVNVVRALKNMAGPAPQKQTGMAAWARQRLRNSFGQERAQAQVFEALSVSKGHGGPNKLSDVQSELISRWLNQESIENFCKGEERIHRFCFEIQKCAGRLAGENLLESPVLWSSVLYQLERQDFVHGKDTLGSQIHQQHLAWTTGYAFADPNAYSSTPEISIAQSQSANNPGLGFSFGPQGSSNLSGAASGEYKNVLQDPALFSMPDQLRHQNAQNWALPPSPISPVMKPDLAEACRVPRTRFVERIRQSVTALLISDLGQSLWASGSETDHWMNDSRNPIVSMSRSLYTGEGEGLYGNQEGNFISGKDTLVGGRASLGKRLEADNPEPAFSFEEGFQVLLKRFQLSTDPHIKLETLYDLSRFTESSVDSMGRIAEPTAHGDISMATGIANLSIHGTGVPRTRLTRLEEVIANCEERRLMSLGDLSTTGNSYNPRTMAQAFASASQVDPRATAVIRLLFLDPQYRPSTFFRDLQLIAAFVPSTVLDHTPQGAAFWTVGLAAMTLKSETCKSITKCAAEILAHHLNNGNRKEPTRADQSEIEEQAKADHVPSMSEEELADTTLEDAARLYSLSAMEGDPTAARELALFYLTHPEIVRRVMLPLSKPGEVFRSSFALAGGDKGREGEGILDPSTFAVAFHWMEFAADAGDRDAKTFLRENGDLGRGW